MFWSTGLQARRPGSPVEHDRPAYAPGTAELRSFAFAVVALLFARRSAQLLDPQVWAEEGRIVSALVNHGLASFLEPLNGYFVTLPRLLSLLALLVPLRGYPLAVTLLTWSLTVALLGAVTFVPSRLRGGPALAFAALLAPTNAEVFGVSLFAFWWAAVFLYACAFWLPGRTVRPWRLAAVAVAGLSTPAIVLTVPLFVWNALRRGRTADDVSTAMVAAACGLVQLVEILITGASGDHLAVSMIPPFVEKYVGGYLVWNLLHDGGARQFVAGAAGVATLVFIGIAGWRARRTGASLFALVYLWLGSQALSVARMDPHVTDAALAGPRYFFLPFVVESWLLIAIATGDDTSTVRKIAVLMLACATFNALPVLSRTHDDLAWPKAIAACAAAPDAALVEVPIESNGQVATHWVLRLTGRQCRHLDRSGLAGLALTPDR